MKVICINDITLDNDWGDIYFVKLYITIGKSYEVIKEKYNKYYVMNDNQRFTDYDKDNFVTLKEYRKQKLEKILFYDKVKS